MANRILVAGVAAVLVLAVAAAGLWRQGQADPDPDASLDEVLPIPPVPPRIAEGEQYDQCLSMLNTDPSGAFTYAEAWEPTGGGEAATHCRALAEVALGEPDLGAARLDTLAAHSTAPPAARASIYGQAGQAWLMAGDAGRAYASSTQALALTQDDADLLIDRAIAASNLERYEKAVDDLSRALDIDPRRVDALVLRAGAWRHVGKLDMAREDVDRAFELDAENPDALLERGILRQRGGDPRGARQDWEQAIALAPDSATGDLAQQNLALLEAGPERR
ncbi:MAG: tetratricopeptide repeat protein [Acetobacteraceae bacterium]